MEAGAANAEARKRRNVFIGLVSLRPNASWRRLYSLYNSS